MWVGSNHPDVVASHPSRITYLQLLLVFTQHPNWTLAAFAPPFWYKVFCDQQTCTKEELRERLCPDECSAATLTAIEVRSW